MTEKTLFEYQKNGIDAVVRKYAGGLNRIIFQLATGGGKCLGKDTPVLMYDGSIKKVQDIKTGELLMGPDSKPRTVLSTCKGIENLYKIIPVKGDPYIVNESHILSLKRTSQLKNPKHPCQKRAGEIVNISVKDYIAKSKTFKHLHKGWRTGVDFENNSTLKIDPYILGLWLGDGSTRIAAVATMDLPVIKQLEEYALANNCTIRHEQEKGKCGVYHFRGGTSRGVKGGSNEVLNQFKHYGLINNKHIPFEYKTASRKDRLKLLAGLIDSDGYLHHNGYDIVTKLENLADDICFLARSLGFGAYKKRCTKKFYNNGVIGTYYRVMIFGDCNLVPVKLERKKAKPRNQPKSVLVTGIKVEPIGPGEYYGFEIDGDHLFMLGDFTVTHNTVCFSALADRYLRKQQKRILILVHREELLQQAYKTLYHWYGIVAAPVTADTTYLPNVMVYIAMVETANNRLKKNPIFFGTVGLVIIDEAHLGNFKKIFPYYPNTLCVGFTATPISGDKKDPLKNYFQDIICGVDIPTLIKEGTLVKNITINLGTVKREDLSVKGGEFEIGKMSATFSGTRHIQNCVAMYQQHALGKKTIIFNCDIEHSKKVAAAFKAFGYDVRHVDGDTPTTERKKTLEWFAKTPGAIICNVDVFNAGFDEPTIQCVIMNTSTMSLTSWLQKTGRGGRKAPGKSHFIILDLGGNANYHGDWSISRDWREIFHKPEVITERRGEAPSKACVGCKVIISAGYQTCPHCGAKNTRKVIYDPKLIPIEELFIRRPIQIDVQKIVDERAGKLTKAGTPVKDLSALHAIKTKMVYHVSKVWKLKRLDDRTAQQLIDLFQEKVLEWCTIKNKTPDKYIMKLSRQWLLEEFHRVFEYNPPEHFQIQKHAV